MIPLFLFQLRIHGGCYNSVFKGWQLMTGGPSESLDLVHRAEGHHQCLVAQDFTSAMSRQQREAMAVARSWHWLGLRPKLGHSGPPPESLVNCCYMWSAHLGAPSEPSDCPPWTCLTCEILKNTCQCLHETLVFTAIFSASLPARL